jgi:hypothetical protein
MMQGPDVTPSYMMALTAVLLQAAIADPDLVQAHLADQQCWPALLAICKPEPTASAVQHAHHLTQLACTKHGPLAHCHCSSTTSHQHLPSPHTSADLSPEAVCADVADCTEALRSNAKHQEPTQGRSSRHRSTMAVDLVEEDVLHAQHAASTAGAASHVAQITAMMQNQAVQGDTPPGYANADALEALLHCYSMHAQAASSQLPEPVWPMQNARQKQQQAMLRHVAQAGEHLKS